MGRKLTKTLLAILAASGMNSAIGVAQLSSATGNVVFGSDVSTNNACAILIRNQGTLVTNLTATQLSSNLPGGVSGIADVFAIFPFQIWIGSPPFFSSRPTGGDDNVTFATTFSGQALNGRGVNFPPRPGDQRVQFPSFFGATRLTVDLEANRPDSFPNGDYTAETTIFCE